MTPHRLPFAALISCLFLSAGNASAAPEPKLPSLALIGVQAGEGFTDKQIGTIEEVLLQSLYATKAFKVVGRSDVAVILQHEAQKEASGCSDNSDSCMAQIAGAFGVDMIARAEVGRLGSITIITFKVISVRTGDVIARIRQTVKSDAELVDASDAIARDAAAAVATGAAPKPLPPAVVLVPPTPVSTPPPAVSAPPAAQPAVHPMSIGRILGIVGLVVGGAALVTGTGLGLAAQNQTAEAKKSPQGSSVPATVNGINTIVTGAVVGWTAGGVLAAGGLGLVVAF